MGRCRAFILLICLGIVGAWMGLAQTVPASECETVSGQKVVLPSALLGHRTVLVMSFSREAGPVSDGWAAALAGEAGLAGIPVYRAAMLESAPGFVRSLIRFSLRRQLSATQQPFYWVFSRDEKLWRSVLHPAGDKLPVVVLTASDGRILWRGQGTAADLLPQLRAAMHQQNEISVVFS